MSTDAGRQHEMQLALNSLITTLVDSQKGFADIGEHLKDETLKRYFLAESLKRASFRGDQDDHPDNLIQTAIARRGRYKSYGFHWGAFIEGYAQPLSPGRTDPLHTG